MRFFGSWFCHLSGPRSAQESDCWTASAQPTSPALDHRDEAVQGHSYQLLHRSYAAILTALDERAKRAVLLVHSFADAFEAPWSGWGEFSAFAEVLGVEGQIVPGVPVEAGVRDGVEFWLGWVSNCEASS